MMSKTEMRILELMFDDLSKEYSILNLSKITKLPYPQVHRTVKVLIKKNLIIGTKKGKAIIVKTDLKNIHKEYINIELTRLEKAIKKNRNLAVLSEDLEEINPVQFICIIFGSCVKKRNPKDIDLLFIIPENYKTFEKKIRALTMPKLDINITTEKGLLEMWRKPGQLNVGNELLKNHLILKGAEAFLYLRRKYYVG